MDSKHTEGTFISNGVELLKPNAIEATLLKHGFFGQPRGRSLAAGSCYMKICCVADTDAFTQARLRKRGLTAESIITLSYVHTRNEVCLIANSANILDCLAANSSAAVIWLMAFGVGSADELIADENGGSAL